MRNVARAREHRIVAGRFNVQHPRSHAAPKREHLLARLHIEPFRRLHQTNRVLVKIGTPMAGPELLRTGNGVAAHKTTVPRPKPGRVRADPRFRARHICDNGIRGEQGLHFIQFRAHQRGRCGNHHQVRPVDRLRHLEKCFINRSHAEGLVQRTPAAARAGHPRRQPARLQREAERCAQQPHADDGHAVKVCAHGCSRAAATASATVKACR